MERLEVFFDKKENRYTIQAASSNYFVMDLSKVVEPVKIDVFANLNIDLLLINAKDDLDITFDIQSGTYLRLCALANNPLKTMKITANVAENATLSTYLADFVPEQCRGDVFINLNEEGATCDWHLASLSKNADKKEFDVNVYHNAISTFAQLDNYGVVRDNAKLTFSGICHIIKGSRGSKAHQNAKIMVFDEKSNGIAKPILKIDENDIEASHAAVVGKINDEHIFYLTSRGLSEEEAKRLITLGYLKPIMTGFADDEMKNEIEALIEGEM